MGLLDRDVCTKADWARVAWECASRPTSSLVELKRELSFSLAAFAGVRGNKDVAVKRAGYIKEKLNETNNWSEFRVTSS